jgi:hypothetical protein
MTQDPQDLTARWERFVMRPFPRRLAGQDVAGIEPALLDTEAAGCVSTFVARGALDPRTRDIAAACAADLRRLVAALEGEPADYFAELLALTEAVLTKTR